MTPKPHSKTVRGTFDNAKTQEAIKTNKPIPMLGDATSLKPEADDKPLSSNDSAPPPRQDNDASSGSLPKEDLPHSKTVRGTLANSDGKKLDNKQLGDPVSVKAETSKSEMGKDVEREGGNKLGKSKL